MVPVSLLASVEEKVRAFVQRLDGEAVKAEEAVVQAAKETEAEALAEVTHVEETVAKVVPVITGYEEKAAAALEKYGPEAVAAAKALVGEIAADVKTLLHV